MARLSVVNTMRRCDDGDGIAEQPDVHGGDKKVMTTDKEPMSSAIDRQREIEKQCLTNGRIRFLEKVEKATAKKQTSKTAAGQQAMQYHLAALIEGFDVWL